MAIWLPPGDNAPVLGKDDALKIWEQVAAFTTQSLPLIDLAKLAPLYDIFPPTQCACDDLGKCCRANLLFLSSYEWHNVVLYVQAHFSDTEKAELVNLWTDYESRFVQDRSNRWVLPCSLLDRQSHACRAHPARPMPCRAYGGIEGSCVDCKRETSVPFGFFSEKVREMEGFSAKMQLTDGSKVPISLPLEIWMRVAVAGLPQAMTEFYSSKWFEETKKGQTPFGAV